MCLKNILNKGLLDLDNLLNLNRAGTAQIQAYREDSSVSVMKYRSSLSPEKEKEGCCDPAPQIKSIALLDCNCYTDIGFYLVCQTKPIDDKIFKMEKNFAHVRDIICEWDV